MAYRGETGLSNNHGGQATCLGNQPVARRAVKIHSVLALSLFFLVLLPLFNAGCALTSGSTGDPNLPQSLKITTSGLPAATPQAAYQASLSATGGKAPYTWSISSGTLPPGLSLTGSTGTIAGQPSTAGNYSFVTQVQDSSSPSNTATHSLSINVGASGGSLKITTTTLPSGQNGTAYSASVAASGGKTPYTWSLASGALPVGLALSGTSGAISGTPTTTGTSSFTVKVSDAAAATAQQALSVQINATGTPSALTITTTSLPAGAVSTGYSALLQATGGKTPYSWSITSGQFPVGLALNSSSGAIGGVPTSAGQFTFTAQVSDSTLPANTASQSITVTIAANSTQNVGPGSTIPGGLMSLPPARQLGTNVLPNGGLESGNTGWYIPNACWTVDSNSADAHSGSNSMKYNYSACSSTSPSYAPNFVFQANTSYTVGVWAKASSGSNLQLQLDMADATDSGLSVGGSSAVAIGTNWTFVTVADLDLLAIHNGDNITTRFAVSAPSGQTPTGTLWIDDVTSQPETPLPISTFLLYPNFRGYLWQNGSQTIRLHVESGNPSGNTAQIVVQTEGGSVVNTITQPAQASQEIDVDGTSLALGSYLIHTNLLDSSGAVISSYPDYRVTKVSAAFQSSLVNYIDTDNFLVHNGQKEFVWGVYDRTSSVRCSLCMYPTSTGYESSIAGFNGMGTLANYQDTQLNAMTNFAPWSAMSPGPPAVYDYLDPAMQALQNRGVGYIQTINNWTASNQYRPFWASSLTDPQLWQLAGSMMSGKSDGIGYYTYDEPTLGLLPGVFSQYQTVKPANPGSVTWGALISASQIYRWRDMSDVIGSDPYPIGLPTGVDDYAAGMPNIAATSPSYIAPTIRVSVWTQGTEQQVLNSRPVWMVLQLWRQWGKFPIYEQMKQSAYKAIISGANGIMWWGFVSGVGVEGEWYSNNDQQAYFDFKKLSGEVQGLKAYLTTPPQPQDLASVSAPKIETLVKTDPTHVVIFATSDSASAVSNVTFNLANVVPSGSTVTVYSENRSVTLNGMSFTDSFNPLEAHVYIVTVQ